MASRYHRHRPEFDQHLAGVAANFDGDCANCPEPINVRQRVVRTRDGWVHVQCSAGWDE